VPRHAGDPTRVYPCVASETEAIMFEKLSVLSMVAVAAVAAAPRAVADDLVRVDVPFEFVVDGRPLPSGEYRFELDQAARIVHVRSKDRGHVAMTVFQTAPSATKEAGVAFHKHAGQRFLKTVSTGHGYDIALPTTHAERVAEAADGGGKPVAVGRP
jgi:hypothetical protein